MDKYEVTRKLRRTDRDTNDFVILSLVKDYVMADPQLKVHSFVIVKDTLHIEVEDLLTKVTFEPAIKRSSFSGLIIFTHERIRKAHTLNGIRNPLKLIIDDIKNQATEIAKRRWMK